MERGDDGKFRKSAPPATSTSGEDASGTGETAYEEPVQSLATPVAAASMPALPSGAGTMGAEVASIVAEEAFWNLDGPVVRITTPHVPLPAAANLEDETIPSVERIVETIRKTANA